MGNSVGRIQLDLGINSKGFKKELDGISGKAKGAAGNISSSLAKIGKMAAVAFSVKAVVDFGRQCLALGSDLAEVQNVVDVTFGSMSERVNEFAQSAITSYGLSEKVAKEYMGQFGAMSKAFGNGTAAAYEQTEALTALSGDVASFYNISTDEAFTKLKSVYTGETESLKSLGVVMTQTALDSFAMAKGFGKTTKSMSEQEKVALRLAFVQDKLSASAGDFARTSDGWANQTRVLSLRFDALKASIGQGLINVLTPVVKILNDLMARLQTVADGFRDLMSSIFGDAGGADSSISQGATDLATGMESGAESAQTIKKSLAGFDEINVLGSDSGESSTGAVVDKSSLSNSAGVAKNIGKASGFADKLKNFFSDFKKTASDFINNAGFITYFEALKQSALNFAGGFKNIGISFGEAINNLQPQFENLKERFASTFTTISQTCKQIEGDMWLSLSEGFLEFTETYSPEIETFYEGLLGSLAVFAADVLDAVNDIGVSLGEWWDSSGKKLWDGIVGCLQDIGGWFLKIWNSFIQPILDTFISEANALWDQNLKPLWDKILDFITSVGNYVLMLWNQYIKPFVDWLIDNILPIFTPIFQAILKVIKDVTGAVADALGGLLDALGGVLDFLTGVFTGDWEKAWNGVKKIFTGIWDAFKGIVRGAVNSIIDIINGLWSGLYAALAAVVNGVGGLIKDLGEFFGADWGWEIPTTAPQIPRLATGGYVAANTPRLAVIGDNKREGEIVAPESKIAEAVAAGISAALSKMQNPQKGDRQPVIIKIGENDFWRGFIDYHNSLVLRTGESPLIV